MTYEISNRHFHSFVEMTPSLRHLDRKTVEVLTRDLLEKVYQGIKFIIWQRITKEISRRSDVPLSKLRVDGVGLWWFSFSFILMLRRRFRIVAFAPMSKWQPFSVILCEQFLICDNSSLILNISRNCFIYYKYCNTISRLNIL